jgi:hypothetical protein
LRYGLSALARSGTVSPMSFSGMPEHGDIGLTQMTGGQG